MVDFNKEKISEYDYRKTIADQNYKIAKDNELLLQNSRELDLYKQKYNEIINSRSWKLVNKLRKRYYRFRCFVKNKKPEDRYNYDINVIEKNIKDYKMVKHENISKYKCYDSHYEDNIDFSNFNTDIKTIAFYLPQYYTFKENDEWWGKGFTEWTNVKKSKPKFDGHYQPRIPHSDFGYYKLDNIETIKKQITLAKQHGIYAFCYYYYWFSGKRLLDKPLDLFLKSDIDFPFVLCWANENWTRTWDGLESNVLIKQDYSNDDAENFIVDIMPYFKDKRYIKIDGKPLLLVYNPSQIPNCEYVIKKWREKAMEIGIGEIVVWFNHPLGNIEFNDSDYIDGYFDFAPNSIGHEATILDGVNETKKIFNYEKIVRDIRHLYYEHFSPIPFHYSVTMGWDNSARKSSNFKIYYNYSPAAFYYWLRYVIEVIRMRNSIENRYIFVNAWNEWGEGTYLEPDEKFGYTNINTLSKAIFDIPYSSNNFICLDRLDSHKISSNKKMAIQLHCYYISELPQILKYLNNVSIPFDLFVSTDSIAKKEEIISIINDNKINSMKNCSVEIFQNKGRDILPFIMQLKNIYINYDYIAHIHTKKSIHNSYGKEWLDYELDNIYGSKEIFEKNIFLLERNNFGIVSVIPFKDVVDKMLVGSNESNLKKLSKMLKFKYKNDNTFEYLDFPAGSFFIVQSNAIKDLFKINDIETYFVDEKGQDDGTFAHAVERSLYNIALKNGYKSIEVLSTKRNFK